MVRPVTNAPIPQSGNRPVSQTANVAPATETAKSNGRSIGHAARTAIADATAAREMELPKNMHGKAASALARGLPLPAILRLQETAAPETVNAAPAPAQPDDPATELPEGGVVTDPTQVPASTSAGEASDVVIAPAPPEVIIPEIVPPVDPTPDSPPVDPIPDTPLATTLLDTLSSE